MTQTTTTAEILKTTVGAGQVVFFAYPNGIDGDMLRDKRGVGRRFKSFEAARRALTKTNP